VDIRRRVRYLIRYLPCARFAALPTPAIPCTAMAVRP
jgi:hypothetical protein